jgi:hypothetical protein
VNHSVFSFREDSSSNLSIQLVLHHLKIVGLCPNNQLKFFDKPTPCEANDVISIASLGKVCVVLNPSDGFAITLGLAVTPISSKQASELFILCSINQIFKRLKTLHPVQTYYHPDGEAIVVDADSSPVWLWVPVGRGGLLIIGTNLPGDLIRYRQGDPAQADNRPKEMQWGIPGERPNYLFENQISGEDGTLRHADHWAILLAKKLSQLCDQPLKDILPRGAPGAIVITGDDDQAYLEKYDEQLTLLEDLPITYLLHPLTRHTRKTIRDMQMRNPNIDFGIHPDALDAPAMYDELMAKQVIWYHELMNASPLSLRNHGFLNDGYWGHLDSWLKHEVRISSNLPGLDGRVLNGSMLPARMAWNGRLTDHWSILTAIGDGIRFISGMTDEDAANRVWVVANRIRSSRLPGVMVLNLHPQNVSQTRAMHHAAKEIIRSGFVAWNLRQCLDWFDSRDIGSRKYEDERGSWFTRQWTSLCGSLYNKTGR